VRHVRATLILAFVFSCSGPEPFRIPPPPVAEPRVEIGDSIVACGKSISIGAPVVLWTDPNGYDATSTSRRFRAEGGSGPSRGALRYTPGRAERGEHGAVLVPPGSVDLALLQSVVDLFVLHYDACGTSRRCFEILQDVRGLSVHFLLDLDGTLYQTMDLRDQAWHATEANPRSIGIEIANVGAFPPGDRATLDEWYRDSDEGTRITIPASEGPSRMRRADFIPRPSRESSVQGTIQGKLLEQYDLTPEQYDSLVCLAAGLCQLFPRITPDAPRDRSGRVRTDALDAAELASFRGILGHYHISTEKVDPGPAFDWQAFLARVRTRMSANASLDRLRSPLFVERSIEEALGPR
jgi:N-acetyl-anhydromuramyl-L-alanine amidase AmpD